MSLKLRFAVPADLPDCVAMAQTAFGWVSENDMQAYAQFLDTLLRQGRALCAVIVDESDQPLAFGLTIFISDEFRENLIQAKHARMGVVIRYRAGRNAILYPRKILEAHRGEGLNILGFYSWRMDVPPALLETSRQLLWRSFPYIHRGYHLKSFLKEVYGKQEWTLYAQLGCETYKQPRDYIYPHHFHEPYLMGLERDAAQFPSRLYDLFCTDAPRLMLTDRQRIIGQLGCLLKLDNQHIAECLAPTRRGRKDRANNSNHITVKTVYATWHQICQQLQSASEIGVQCCRHGGRLRVLLYAEQHPEVFYPLNIHTLFYNHPELAYRYPIPLDAD